MDRYTLYPRMRSGRRSWAQETLDVARAGLARTDAALAEARQQVQLAIQSLKFHEARLADTRLRAPFDGMIVERFRDPGAIAVPGTPVLTLISLDEMWISAWVDETRMSVLQVGQPADVLFRSEPDKIYSGEVIRLGRQADRETREFLVDVRVLELPANWAVGQRSEVYIEVARESQAVIVPADFVQIRNGERGVLTVTKAGTIAWRGIRVGLADRDRLQVVSGLQLGEQIALPVRRDVALEGRRIRPRCISR